MDGCTLVLWYLGTDTGSRSRFSTPAARRLWQGPTKSRGGQVTFFYVSFFGLWTLKPDALTAAAGWYVCAIRDRTDSIRENVKVGRRARTKSTRVKVGGCWCTLALLVLPQTCMYLQLCTLGCGQCKDARAPLRWIQRQVFVFFLAFFNIIKIHFYSAC